jgi:hypothetical protein
MDALNNNIDENLSYRGDEEQEDDLHTSQRNPGFDVDEHNENPNEDGHTSEAERRLHVVEKRQRKKNHVKDVAPLKILQMERVQRLTKLSHSDLGRFEAYCTSVKATNALVDRNAWISTDCAKLIDLLLKVAEIKDYDKWREWSDDKFFLTLKRQCPPPNTMSSSRMLLADQVKSLKLTIDFTDLPKSFEYFVELQHLVEQDRAQRILITPEDIEEFVNNSREIIKSLVLQLTKHNNRIHRRVGELMKENGFPLDFDAFIEKMMKILKKLQYSCQDSLALGMKFEVENNNNGTASNSSNKNVKNDDVSFKKHNKKNHKTATEGDNQVSNKKQKFEQYNSNKNKEAQKCSGCGRDGHTWGNCVLNTHPDFNKEKTKWVNSTSGKAWKLKGFDVLPFKKTLSGAAFDAPRPPKKHQGEILNLLNNKYKNKTSNTLTCKIKIQDKPVLDVQVVVDTGAFNNNYISKKTADLLINKYGLINKNKNKNLVCSAFDNDENSCHCSLGNISFNLSIFNELSKIDEDLYLDFSIIDSPYDIIIGRNTITEHGLLYKLIDHFSAKNDILKTLTKHLIDYVDVAHKQSTSVLETTKQENDQLLNSYSAQTIQSTLAILSMHTQQHISNFFDIEENSDGIDMSEDQIEDTFKPKNIIDDVYQNIPTKIFGTEDLKKSIQDLCIEYQDIFSRYLRSESAKLPPMEIKVDLNAWRNKKHRGPPRVQSILKQKEIHRQIKEMCENNVLQSSLATEYSHPLLTPKQDQTWRLVIDYRKFNDCCETMGWPIPNIFQMLHRLGSHRAKFFALMDLTKGYHQAPLSTESQKLTAFTTFMGVYEWLRVPMGIKGAPSYFQQVIATVVLVGLLYVICELYIDDVIVHAQTEKEFIDRLRQVFERFRTYKVTVNPDKCKFGMSEVQFVGHVINENGMTFSREKIDKVMDIDPPQNQKGIRKFIGVVNYFRDHIKNQSILIKPLYDLIHDYQPFKKVIWTETAIAAFNEIKEAINNIPTLYFIESNAPVFLHTDASDYGIGGYLFQVVDGIEKPVAFMSKLFTKTESRWSTPEKEAYAIYHSFKKFEHLIRDIKFSVRTDHRNLTFLNSDTNPKVKRWKLEMQEYDFDIEYLPGEKNVVADAFSRLLPVNNDVERICIIENSEEHIFLLDEFTIPEVVYEKIKKVHNSKVGHHGVERTLKKLHDQKESWKYMREHIRKFIKMCPCCQTMSQIKTQIHTHPFTTATYAPMVRINVDTINGLPPDVLNNRSLICIKDCFSRWIELYPTQNETASVAASALLQFIGRYGCPSQILSDNGPQYVNEVIKELTMLVGTEYITTLAYSKEENAIVERANKEALRHLRAIIFDENVIEKWSQDTIPFVQRIINSSVDSSIGVSPAQILYGNAINLDRGIFLPLQNLETHDNKNLKLSAWVDKMLQTQNAVIKAAEKSQQNKDEQHNADFQENPTEFLPNTYVLVGYPTSSMKKGPPNKLMSNFKGPMQIVNNVGNIYTVKNLLTEKQEKCHITQLKKFYYQPGKTNPKQIAMKTTQEHVVEKIITHVGDKSSKTLMDFKVRWLGESEENDLWLPWKELKNNPALHKYLADNHMKSLITNSHKK